MSATTPALQILCSKADPWDRKERKGIQVAHADAVQLRQSDGYPGGDLVELRPYVPGESMDGISISQPDQENGSPKEGDMIARNPKNHADKWLVAAQYFSDNFEPKP